MQSFFSSLSGLAFLSLWSASLSTLAGWSLGSIKMEEGGSNRNRIENADFGFALQRCVFFYIATEIKMVKETTRYSNYWQV